MSTRASRSHPVGAALELARPRRARAHRVDLRAVQRAHRHARLARGGRAVRPARHLPQRLLRAARPPLRRGRLRLPGGRPDRRQRHRRQDHPAAGAGRAARHALRPRASSTTGCWTSAPARCAATPCGSRRPAAGCGSAPSGSCRSPSARSPRSATRSSRSTATCSWSSSPTCSPTSRSTSAHQGPPGRPPTLNAPLVAEDAAGRGLPRGARPPDPQVRAARWPPPWTTSWTPTTACAARSTPRTTSPG